MFTRGHLMAILVIFTLAMGVLNLYICPAYAVTGYKNVAAGKLFAADATQGWVGFTSTLYFTAASRATDDMWKFTSPSLSSAGSWWTTLGFASDTAAVNVTVTNIAEHDVVYAATGAGTQRLALAGLGEPTDVYGAASTSWDGHILTVTTAGAATVTVHWAVNSLKVGEAGGILIALFPFIALMLGLSFIKYPRHWKILLEVAILIAIVTFFAWLFKGWGL